MIKRAARFALAALSIAALAGCASVPAPKGQTMIAVETSEGAIRIAVDTARAPKMSGWFLALVDQGKFDGTSFYRVGHPTGIPSAPRLIEGGMLGHYILGHAGTKPATVAETGLPMLRDFDTTAQSGLRHVRGALSFALDLTGDGSAVPDMVIATDAIPENDAGGGNSPGNKGFPVIGHVVSGMDVVDRIAAQPRGGDTYVTFLKGQILTKPVTIHRVRRLRASEAR